MTTRQILMLLGIGLGLFVASASSAQSSRRSSGLSSGLSSGDERVNACEPQYLNKFRRSLEPDFVANKEIIMSLLDSAQNRAVRCSSSSDTSVRPNWELMMCGFRSAKFMHTVALSNATQTFTLHVREESVSCGGEAFWLENITVEKGAIVSKIVTGRKLLAQIRGNGCETAEDYQVVRFKFEDGNTREQQVVRLLNVAGERSCGSRPVNEGLIEFDLGALGLTPTEAQSL